MKTIKTVAAACILSLFLTITVPAGEMPGPGAKQTAPKGTSSTTWQPTTCEQVADSAGQINSATPCDEATPNLLNEAMIIAMELLISVY